MLNLYEEVRSVIRTLHAQGIEYAICGGFAVSIHTEPRATEDLDLLILAEDLPRCRAVVQALGYTQFGEPMQFAQGRITLQRLVKPEPKGEDLAMLDLLLVDSPMLAEIWRTRETFEWESNPVWVVSRQGLIALKRLRGSPQDLADIARLEGPAA
jgi:hypothetical protein